MPIAVCDDVGLQALCQANEALHRDMLEYSRRHGTWLELGYASLRREAHDAPSDSCVPSQQRLDVPLWLGGAGQGVGLPSW